MTETNPPTLGSSGSEALGAPESSEAELDALRDAFIPHLVRLRLDDGRRVRRSAPLAALPPEASRLIRALTEARLLTTRTEDGEVLVEVAHEALFSAWPTLAGWLDAEQRFLADIERIKSAHAAWSEAADQEKQQALMQGLLLANAREWVVKYPRRFSGRELTGLRAFIDESATAADAEAIAREAERENARAAELGRAKAETERAQERVSGVRRLLAAAIIAIAGLAGLGGWALVQRNAAIEAKVRADADFVASKQAISGIVSVVAQGFEISPYLDVLKRVFGNIKV